MISKLISRFLFALVLISTSFTQAQEGGKPFDGKNTQIVFIEIREGFVPEWGIERMARDYKQMLHAGGIQVGLVSSGERTMIALAQSIKELANLIKFATQMEEVLSVKYENNEIPGDYITKEEKIKHNLMPKKDKSGKKAKTDL